MFVTPHITTIEKIYTGNLNERNLLYSGMFNLGFIALKNDIYSTKMLDWWEIRLEDRCFQNMMENYFTDQKWIDFLPSFFPEQLFISSNLGLNVAPWNFFEREIVCVDDVYFVKNRINKDEKYSTPLVFVHFSGYNYNALIKGDIVQGNLKNFEGFNDFNDIFKIYAEYIKNSDFLKYINLEYSYNYFSDGILISKIYRSLFRRIFEDKKTDSNPFDALGDFYLSLKENKILNTNLPKIDKVTMTSVTNIERKTIIINKLFSLVFKIIGANKFFKLLRLMRSYSKIENHVYLINKDYNKQFKIRS
jgi:hypothetical protein